MAVLSALATAAFLLGISRGRAQVSTEKKPLAFEVASVRPGKPRAPDRLIRPLPGGQRFITTNYPLAGMIMRVYGITANQIMGAPSWMETDPWDVEAKAEKPSSFEELQEMFQTLLADRFKLRFHRETREMAAYVLSVEKSGSKLKRSDSKDPFEVPIKPGGGSVLVGTRVSPSLLCWNLSIGLNAPVVDQTGLDGFYDYTLDLSQQEPREPTQTSADELDHRRAEMTTAVREQLGLKLEYRKTPVEVFVVDHVERPSEN